MIRRWLGILMLLACLGHLGASPVTHFHLGMGNDFYTMGLGDNLDDGLSFGGHFMVEVKDIVFFKADALGFTNRASNGNRYDQINMNLYTPLTFFWRPIVSTLTPLVGMSLEGDFDFDQIQNNLHQRMNIPGLALPYDRTEARAHLNLGSTVQTMVRLGWVELGLEASYLHTFGWENSIQTLAVIKLGNALTLKGGYSFMHDFAAEPTHHVMMDRLSGPTFSYYFDGGLVTNSWIYHINSGSSYGVFGIDVMQLFQPATYDHTDFTYSLDFLYDMAGHQNRSFSLAFGPIIWQTRHKSGPIKNDPANAGRRMTIASWMVGYLKEWEATEMIHPYLETLWGYQRFNLRTGSAAVDIILEETRATIALEAGIKFGRDGQWVARNNSYRPKFTTSIQYVFGTKTIKDQDTAFAKYVGPWIFMVGIGLDIGHDPH